MRHTRHPALDGVRGVAVAAVVCFHLWPRWFPGGWLGVSLFFTLSGFLIVGLVDRELAAGEFSPLDFYRRRARRLLPALSVTLIGVMAAVWVTHPDAIERIRADVVAAVAYVANWRQAAEPGGYEAIFDTTPRPLAHLWSLAIEEQVYLIVPGLLLLTRRPVATISGLGVVGAAGLWFWWGDPDLYFATPVRALEVLAGGAVALWLNRRPPETRRPWSHPVQIVGLAAMVALVATVSESDAITWSWLIPAVAIMVWCPLVMAATAGAGALAWSPLRWLGARSYAIYLFHWPLWVLTSWSAPVVVVVTLALADFSYRLVEMPIRRGSVVARAPLVRLAGATAVIGMIAVVAPPINGPAVPLTPAEALAAVVVEPEERPIAVSGSPVTAGPTVELVASAAGPTLAVDLTAPTPVADRSPPSEGGRSDEAEAADAVPTAPDPVRTVLLAGDSTAMRIEEPLRLWAEENGIELTTKVQAACSPVAGSWEVRIGFVDWPHAEISDCAPDVGETAVDAVLLVHHGVLTFQHRLPGGHWDSVVSSESLRSDLVAAYEAIADGTDARVFIASVPEIDLSRPNIEPEAAVVASSLIHSLAAVRPDIVMLDSSWVTDDPDRFGRSDGLHLDPLGAAAYVVDIIAPALLGTG